MKLIMERWRKFLAEKKYGKTQNVVNRESYSELIMFTTPLDLFIPLGAKLLQRVYGELPENQTGYHITRMNGVYGLLDMQGTTKQVSAMTLGMQQKFIRDGIAGGGGFVVELEGRVVASAMQDLFSIPTKSGRRNVQMGMLKKLIMDPSITDPMTNDILETIKAAQEIIQPSFKEGAADLYDPGELEAQLEMEKGYNDPLPWWYTLARNADGKTLHKMIKYYLDSVEPIMVKYADALKDGMLSNLKLNSSSYKRMDMWDENVMDKIKVKNVYVLNTHYAKRGQPGYPSEEQFKQFISDMDREGVDLHSAKAQEIIDTVEKKIGAKR